MRNAAWQMAIPTWIPLTCLVRLNHPGPAVSDIQRHTNPWVCPLLVESVELEPLAQDQSAKPPPYLCILVSLLHQKLVCLYPLVAAIW